jgi:hypothetical protein
MTIIIAVIMVLPVFGVFAIMAIKRYPLSAYDALGYGIIIGLMLGIIMNVADSRVILVNLDPALR